MLEELYPHLFPDDGEHTYAIVDGASCEELLDRLAEFQPENVCLYTGELAPDVAECAPYLVRLEPGTDFCRWFVDEGWGKHWGIFLLSPTGMQEMRKHLRTFLLVRSPEGKSLYFRYYDPRVLGMYLPTVNAAERKLVFGKVRSFFCETEAGGLLAFRRDGARLEGEIVYHASSIAEPL